MTTIPMQVTFRGIAHSDALEADIRERAASLEQFYARITRCRVLVALPHRHHRDGRQFQVRVDLTIPGTAPLDVSASSLDAHMAVHDAFDAARRRLEDVAREQRGAVKAHAERSAS